MAGTSFSPTNSRHSLVLCASLVQNPMNLGALCRTAEVFGLTALVVPSEATLADPTFRKVSVSAHRWQLCWVCPPEHLAEWLCEQHTAGYEIWALTRAKGAIALHQFQFPQRIVLVLGRELTGIPDEILSRCSGAIAIPQFGRIESLNVQTAAAIATYAYRCQHGFSNPDPSISV